MNARKLSPADHFLTSLDAGIRTVFGTARAEEHTYPASAETAPALSPEQRALSACLLRVNHAGEVAAQALYRGHALTAQSPAVQQHMERAACDENDHLAWCERRISELQGHTSVINPLWYAGSFAIGALAGRMGDKWSLGFVAETEEQVVRHLEGHIKRLPPADTASQLILMQMRDDEAAHARGAIKAGAVPLPGPVKGLMGLVARVMTGTAYWI